MSQLTELQNISKILAEKLEAVGISNPEELQAAGSENALIRISSLTDHGACINMLYALEGAIQGIRWHGLSQERKEELKDFYRQLNKS